MVDSGTSLRYGTGYITKETLIKAGLMQLQFKMCEFKAKVARNSTAIAKTFNAEITRLGCRARISL
jgi:hypothetical protein